MKILFVIDSMKLGGAQTYVITLMNQLKAMNYEVAIATDNGELLERVDSSLQVHRLPLDGKNVFKIIQSIIGLRHILKKSEISIIHSNALIPAFICKIAMLRSGRKIKHVFTVHKIWEKDILFYKKILLPLFYKFIDLSVDQCILINRFSLNIFSKYFNADKINLIYNGIELKHKVLTPVMPSDQSDHLDVKLIFVGRLVPQKRVDLLLRTISHIKENANIKCRIIGDGYLKNYLLKLNSELSIENMVEFLGYRANVQDYLCDSDLFITTSEWEGISYSMLEALNAQIPFVGFDVPGVNEVVEENRNGVLVPFGDTEELAHAIMNLIDNCELYEKLRIGCKEILEEKFEINKMVEKTEKVYHKMISKNYD